MKIRAIETDYNGYRFRSRQEARWAVFFDYLGLEYEYEKEGFALPSGWYLPDFWIPKWNTWIEIKGDSPTPEELQKVFDLVKYVGPSAHIFTTPYKEGTSFIWEYLDGIGAEGSIWEITSKFEDKLGGVNLSLDTVWNDYEVFEVKELPVKGYPSWRYNDLLFTVDGKNLKDARKAYRSCDFRKGVNIRQDW